MKPEGMSEELVTEMRVVADRIEMQAIGASHAATVLRKMADEVQGLASKLSTAVEALRMYSAEGVPYVDEVGRYYYRGDGGHRARAALKKIEGGDV